MAIRTRSLLSTSSMRSSSSPAYPSSSARTSLRETWKMIVRTGGDCVSNNVRDVQESGDLAFDTGIFTGTGPDGSLTSTGKWIVIWQRQSGGEWKIVRDFTYSQTVGSTDQIGRRRAGALAPTFVLAYGQLLERMPNQ